MGNMKKRVKLSSESEIDKLVITQADDESAWEKPERVRRSKSASVSIPADVASRAAFFARLHRASNVEDWIKKILLERIDLEEAAFAETKRDLASQ
jgi:hypothetical protein